MDSNEQVAREIVGEYKQRIAQLPSDGIVPCEKWLAKRLEILLDLHTAALVEKEREVWDKAIGIVSENFHVFGQDILPALEAARTSEKP